jgi:hypothetical protein
MSNQAFDAFLMFDAFDGIPSAGTLIPEIGLQLTALGGAQLRAEGGFQLRADGTEFSSLPSMLFANPNNAVFAAMINNNSGF